MSGAEIIARLGLGVVDADDLVLRELALGWYGVPTRAALPVADAVVGPCATRDAAAVALATRLVEIQCVRNGLEVDGARGGA